MKKYRAEYYSVTEDPKQKGNFRTEHLGDFEFYHTVTINFPVERKAFLVCPQSFLAATEVKVIEL